MTHLPAPSPLLAAESTLVDACGEEPGWLCQLIWETTGSGALAQALTGVLKVPVILIAAFVLYRVMRAAVDRFVRRMEGDIRRRIQRAQELGTGGGTRRAATRRMQRLHAIGGAVRSGLGIVIWLTALLMVVAQFFDLRPILAGAGLAGLVIGFGAQNLIRDFLAGVSMLVEDQFGVGDWIEVNDRAGEVENVGLRTTRMRDIDGVVWHVPNGYMQMVGNLTQRWARATLDVPFALDTDVAKVRRLVQQVADELAADPEWSRDIIGPPEIWGMQTWGPEGASLRLVIPTRPIRNWDVNRQMRERLKYAFEQAGIRMPAPMLEVGAQRTGQPVRITDVDDEPPPRPQGYRRMPDTTDRIPTTRPVEPSPDALEG